MSPRRGNAIFVLTLIACLAVSLAFGALGVGAAPQGTAEITAPAANAGISGNVEIRGTATATNFQFYKLEWGQGATPAQWLVIGELRRTPVTNGVLGTFNTTGLANGPIVLKLTVVDNTGNFLETTRAVTIGAAQPEQAEPPRRGCLACHVLLPAGAAPPGVPPGAFTLAFEAVAADPNHPRVSPSGVSLQPTDQTGPGPCLECHRPGGGGSNDAGVAAPINLRTIVHPAHLFSEIFVGEFRGNCWTCHNVDGNGQWLILGEAVRVNESGVPQQLPIPGAIPVPRG